MLLGARFVCARCRLRGAARVCPRCARERLDLTGPGALEALRRDWPLSTAWERGLSFVSPRSIPVNRPLLGVTLVATLGVTLGAPVMAALGRPGVSAIEVAVALAVSLVMSPFIAIFFALFFFYYAHVLRLVLMLVVLLMLVLPLGRLRLAITAFFVRFLAGAILPRIELDEVPPFASAREGQLAESVALHNVRDGFGWMDRADAWTGPFEVETPSGALRVDPRAGSLCFTLAHYRDAQARQSAEHGTYRHAARAEESPIPAWAAGHGRKARAVHRTIARGRPVRIMGGTLVEGVLTGTPEAPIHLEIS